MLTLALVVSSCGDGGNDKKSDSSDDDKKEKKNEVKNSNKSNDSNLNESASMYCDCMGTAMELMIKMAKREITEDEAQKQMSDCSDYVDNLSEEDTAMEQANCPELTMEKIQAKAREMAMESMKKEIDIN